MHLSHICIRLEIPSWQKFGSWIRRRWRRAISASSLLRNRPKQMICLQAWCFSTTLEHYTAHIRHERLQCFHWSLLEHPPYCVGYLMRPAVGKTLRVSSSVTHRVAIHSGPIIVYRIRQYLYKRMNWSKMKLYIWLCSNLVRQAGFELTCLDFNVVAARKLVAPPSDEHLLNCCTSVISFSLHSN